MKKLAILIFLLVFFPLAIIEVQATDDIWEEGEVISGDLGKYQYDNQYKITLDEDARLTFTLKDFPDNDKNRGGKDYIIKVIGLHYEGLAYISTSQNDGDPAKTVQSVNLKKGSYDVNITKFNYDSEVEYSVSYQTSPIIGTDIEPNNNNQTAMLLKMDDTVSGELNGIGINQDHDMYKIEVTKFGKMKFQLKRTEGTNSPDYLLLSAKGKDGKQHRFYLTSYNGTPNEFEHLFEPGTYYIKIFLGNSEQAISYYTLNTSFTELVEEDWEPDVLKNNKTYNGFWYSVVESDLFSFTLAKDAKVIFFGETLNGLGALSLLRPINVELISNSSKFRVEKELVEGRYYVNFRASGENKDEYKGYTLKMQIQSFKDVPTNHPYYEQIEALTQLGVNKGYPDGSFHPKEAIQRQHVFAFIDRLDGIEFPKIREMKSFTDVNTSQLFYPEIKKFYEAGIINGYGTYMGPNLNVTRGELAKILVNTFKLEMNGNGISFKDVKSSDIFYNDIQILASNRITVGSNGNYMPNDPVTREQFSAFLHRIVNKK
ncbi:S-layer homology domain-containing protein [Ureibacillus acetophenoni]|nr:S-layer homology domain-containing protein [Ureibacillus acetophenoni]